MSDETGDRWDVLRAKADAAAVEAEERHGKTGELHYIVAEMAFDAVCQWMDAAAKPAPTLDIALADVLAWQAATFGPQDAASVYVKLCGEMAEVCDAALAADHLACDPRAVLTECADVLIMLAGFVAARGFTIADLRDETMAKDKINRGRTWRQNADGTWSHVKGGE